MKCKNCGQNLADGAKRCSSCGQDVNAPVNKTKVAVLVVTIILALCVVGIIIWAATRPADDTTTDPTGDTVQTTAGTESTDTTDATGETEYVPTAEDLENHPVLTRDFYTGEEGDTAALAATFGTVGESSITNGQFAIWYWQTYYDFMNYASYYGLDTTTPLDEQTCTLTDVPMTWEQFMLEQSIVNWHSYQALYLEAVAAGTTLSEEDQASLATLEEDMLTTAKQYGHETVNAMLEADYGKGVTLDDYKAFLEILMLGNQYYTVQTEQMNPTAEEVDAYYQENISSFITYGILQDGTPATINVRHILIQPEEETASDSDETNPTEETRSEEELLEEARQKAQAILDQWKAGEATEESFAALAGEYSTDTGSVSNGGLYEDVAPGDMVTAFNDWCFDPERKPGDTDLVETDYGIHIMYFVSASETEYWYSEAEAGLISQMVNNLIEEAMAKYELEIDYSKIYLAPVEYTSAEY